MNGNNRRNVSASVRKTERNNPIVVEFEVQRRDGVYGGVPRPLLPPPCTHGICPACKAVVLLNDRFDPDTYSHGMIGMLGAFAGKRIGADVVAAWTEDLKTIAARDEYFFSLNRYLFQASRPE